MGEHVQADHLAVPALPRARVAVGHLVAEVVHGADAVVDDPLSVAVFEQSEVGPRQTVAHQVPVGEPLVAVAVFVGLEVAGLALEHGVGDLEPGPALDDVVVLGEIEPGEQSARVRERSGGCAARACRWRRPAHLGMTASASQRPMLLVVRSRCSSVSAGSSSISIPAGDDLGRGEVAVESPRSAVLPRVGHGALGIQIPERHEQLRLHAVAGQQVAFGHGTQRAGHGSVLAAIERLLALFQSLLQTVRGGGVIGPAESSSRTNRRSAFRTDAATRGRRTWPARQSVWPARSAA